MSKYNIARTLSKLAAAPILSKAVAVMTSSSAAAARIS